jgi:hypothetical protein
LTSWNETSLCFEDGLKLYTANIWSKRIQYFIEKLIKFGVENDATGDDVWVSQYPFSARNALLQAPE